MKWWDHMPWSEFSECWVLSQLFPVSSFTFIKRLFSSFSLSAVSVVSSAYLKLLIFLMAVLIPACDSSNPAFHMMYSAYRASQVAQLVKNLPAMQEKVKVKLFSHVWLFAMLWTVVRQAPLSMRFSRQGYSSGLLFPSPGDLPNPGIIHGPPTLQADSLPWQCRRHQVNSWLRKFPWRRDRLPTPVSLGFPGDSDGQESTCQCRRHKRCGSIPGSGRSSGEGKGYPLQYSCLENPMDSGAWWATLCICFIARLKIHFIWMQL